MLENPKAKPVQGRCGRRGGAGALLADGIRLGPAKAASVRQVADDVPHAVLYRDEDRTVFVGAESAAHVRGEV